MNFATRPGETIDLRTQAGAVLEPVHWTDLVAGIRKEGVPVTFAQAPATPDARNFSQTGNTVCFALPTLWMGFNHGVPFSEEGGWALALVRDDMRWRVQTYAWVVVKSTTD